MQRIAGNQQRTFLAQWAQVQPHVRTDSSLPRRIKELLGRNRGLGSRDRRLYRELIYTAIRFLPWLEAVLRADPELGAMATAWLAPAVRDTTAYREAVLAGWPEVPESLAEKAAALGARLGRPLAPEELLPAWFREECPEAFAPEQLAAINERAPLWVRLQCRESSIVLDEFLAHGWKVGFDPGSPAALSLPPNAEVAGTDAYRRGFVEIQDLGSQLVLAHAPPARGENWLDACAGAGGKTLQLAALVGEKGRVDACDIRAAALAELRERADRARLGNIAVRSEPGAGYDGVLVDAPCSGSGTWRRLPHMKWYLQPAMISEFSILQQALLAENAPRVRPGGVLVYATCSLSRSENHDVVAQFLARHADFAAAAPAIDRGAAWDGCGSTLLPATLNTDGFYVARLRRRA